MKWQIGIVLLILFFPMVVFAEDANQTLGTNTTIPIVQGGKISDSLANATQPNQDLTKGLTGILFSGLDFIKQLITLLTTNFYAFLSLIAIFLLLDLLVLPYFSILPQTYIPYIAFLIAVLGFSIFNQVIVFILRIFGM